MSLIQMARVWELDLSHSHAWVLQCLADHAGDFGEHVYPSVHRIAWKTGYSTRQVQRILHELIETGIIEVVAEADPQTYRATEYQLHLELAPQKEDYDTWRENLRRGRLSIVPPEEDEAPIKQATPPPDKMSPPPVTQLRRPSPDTAMSGGTVIKPPYLNTDDSREPQKNQNFWNSYLAKVTDDLSDLFRDTRNKAPNRQQVMNLWNLTGETPESFALHMYAARERTQHAKTRPIDDPLHKPMPYFFACLRQILGVDPGPASRDAS